jgi:MoaA/NifB/PqqE/SkfB family radical SAM enzyme
MFFHVVLTTECNLQCKYCYGETLEDFDEGFADFDVDYSLPRKANYDFRLLAKFCSQDPDCVLTFYGGEPLLCANGYGEGKAFHDSNRRLIVGPLGA